MKYIAGFILALVVAGTAVSCEISVWSECRADHSWLYCVRMMSR